MKHSSNVVRHLITVSILALLVFAEPALAQHKGIGFQAILKKPDGTYPTATGLSITLQVLDPSTNCVLREELHTNVSITNGFLNLVLGSSAASTPAGRNPNPVLSIPQIMDNGTTRTGLSCVDTNNNVVATNQNYTPSGHDARKLRIRATVGGDPIVADFNMRAMPFAVNAENLDGKTSSQFVQTSAAITQSNVESIFSRYSVLDAILNGTYAGNAATATALATAPGACPAGQYMSAMSASGTITCSTPGGSVTNVTSANSYLSVATGTTTPVLTVNVGTVANTLAAGNDSRFTDARAPTGAAGGDLSGTYPNPTVAKIDGKAVVTTSLASGEFLKFDGTNWVNATVSTSDATKLPLAGGTMSGAIDMGSQNLTNVGYVTMSSGKSLHLSNNASDPAGLVAADKGKMWFNSTTGQVKYWDGTTAQVVGSASSVIAIANGGTGQTTKAAGFDALSPITSKGDLISSNGTNNVRLSVGTDAYVLTADSSQATGLKWSALPSAPGDATYATKGLVQFDTDAAASGVKVTSGVASVNSGTGANQIVKLDGSAKLPAVDGSALTSLNAGNISSGILPIARGGTNSSYGLTNDKIMVSAGGSIVESAGLMNGQILIGGTGISPAVGNITGSAGVVVTNGANSIALSTDAVSTNTASKLVTRDASGNFAAGAITNTSNILKGATSGTVTMAVPASITSYTLTWPNAVGGAGSFLTTDASGNLSWGSPAAISDSSYAAKGAVQFLTDAATSGITIASGVANVNTGTGANQIVKLTAASKYPAVDGSLVTNLTAANLTGTVAIANGGTGQSTKTAAYDALAPATTKGDIAVYNGTNNVRLAAGTDAYVLTADSSQATGVKWAALPSAPGDATYAAKGLVQILTDAPTSGLTVASGVLNVNSGTAANQIVKLDGSAKLPAVDGSALTNLTPANLSAAVPIAKGGTGQTAKTAAYDALSPITTKGDLISSDGTNNVRLATGTNNYVLTADSTQSSGLKWSALPAAPGDASYSAKGLVQFNTDAATSGVSIASGVATINFGTAANQLVKLDGSAKLPAVDGSALTNLSAGNLTGIVAIAKGGTGQTTKAAAYDALAPTTTKGDIAVYNGTTNVRLPAGADAYVLTADSSQATGVKWTALPSTPGDASYAAKGLVQILTDAATSGLAIASGVLNVNSGTAANQIVKLDGSAKLPAIDGSALTNLSAGNISSGTLPVARGGTAATSFTPDALVVANASGSALISFPCTVGQYLTFGAAGVPTCGNSTTGNSFVKDGNSFGGTATLGTNDTNMLVFETDNTSRMRISATGNVGIGSLPATPLYPLQVYGTGVKTSGTDRILYSQGVANPPSNSTAKIIASEMYLSKSGSSNVGQLVGITAGTDNWDSTGGTIATMTGAELYAEGTNTGSVTKLFGVKGSAYGWAGVTNEMTGGAFLADRYGGGNTTNIIGVSSFAQTDGGTATNMYGMKSSVGFYGSSATNLYGLRVNLDTNDTSVVTNFYGIYLDASKTTNAPPTGRFGIYQAGSNDSNYFAGKVGVGTSSPRAKLDVNGTISGAAALTNAGTTIDFSKGNIQYTNASCQAFSLQNLMDGASYMFVVKGTSAATCSFTGYSDAGSTALTVHLPPDHDVTTAGKHTIYNLVVVGTDVYVAWTPGY